VRCSRAAWEEMGSLGLSDAQRVVSQSESDRVTRRTTSRVSRIQTRTEYGPHQHSPLHLNHPTLLLFHPYYISAVKWPARHVHKNFQTTHQMASLNLIRPNQSHPQGNENVHPWLPQRISPLQSNLEMATSQMRTLAKRRRSRPRILPSTLLHIPRALVTSHLTLRPHNKFLIFSRCQSIVIFASCHNHRSHP
jgi:hypothetical protein